MGKRSKGLASPNFWKTGAVVAAVFVFIGFTAIRAAAEQEQPGVRASNLMDHPVINSKGEEILEIDDLILRRNGKVKRVILSCCGFLGLGTKRVAVPFRRLQLKGNKIIYDITREEFEQMADFNYAEEDLYTGYYSSRPGMARPRTPRRPHPRYYGPDYPRYGTESGYCHWKWSHSPGSILCTAVLDRSVVNTQCQRIGLVNDLLISPDGRVKEIVLSILRLRMSLDKEKVSLPYKPFEVTNWGLTYDVSIEELKDLPEFHYQEGR
jgi:sporulation protein YlmC with PRC-barrel domain